MTELDCGYSEVYNCDFTKGSHQLRVEYTWQQFSHCDLEYFDFSRNKSSQIEKLYTAYLANPSKTIYKIDNDLVNFKNMTYQYFSPTSPMTRFKPLSIQRLTT